MRIVISVFLVIFLFLGTIFGMFTAVVDLNSVVNRKFGNVELQMTKRSSLLEDMVRYLSLQSPDDKPLYEQVSYLSERMSVARSVSQIDTANQNLVSAVNSLVVLVEKNPRFAKDSMLKDMIHDLKKSESMFLLARTEYNDSVREFNDKLVTFPFSLVASSLEYHPKELFSVEDRVELLPSVSF